MQSENILHFNFTFLHKPYSAIIIPCFELSDDEKEKFKIREHSYFIKMLTLQGMKYFELYIAEDLEWHTLTNDPDVADEIIQILGKYVYDKTM